jgi:hypothetical protein
MCSHSRTRSEVHSNVRQLLLLTKQHYLCRGVLQDELQAALRDTQGPSKNYCAAGACKQCAMTVAKRCRNYCAAGACKQCAMTVAKRCRSAAGLRREMLCGVACVDLVLTVNCNSLRTVSFACCSCPCSTWKTAVACCSAVAQAASESCTAADQQMSHGAQGHIYVQLRVLKR